MNKKSTWNIKILWKERKKEKKIPTSVSNNTFQMFE